MTPLDSDSIGCDSSNYWASGVAIYEWTTDDLGIGPIQKIVLTIIAYIIGPIYILVELPKLKSITVDDNHISIKHLVT